MNNYLKSVIKQFLILKAQELLLFLKWAVIISLVGAVAILPGFFVLTRFTTIFVDDPVWFQALVGLLLDTILVLLIFSIYSCITFFKQKHTLFNLWQSVNDFVYEHKYPILFYITMPITGYLILFFADKLVVHTDTIPTYACYLITFIFSTVVGLITNILSVAAISVCILVGYLIGQFFQDNWSKARENVADQNHGIYYDHYYTTKKIPKILGKDLINKINNKEVSKRIHFWRCFE